MSNSEAALTRFLKDTENHTMKIIADDGDVNRSIRFSVDGSSTYSYTLTTWSGHLCISGDMGAAVFRRLNDMSEFFGDGDGINPGYWGEKIQATESYKAFSLKMLQQSIKDWINNHFESHYDIDLLPEQLDSMANEVTVDSDHMHRTLAMEQLTYQTIDLEDHFDPMLLADMFGEHNVPKTLSLEEFAEEANGKYGEYDDFEDYTSRYLWLCWAIAKGLKQYRERATS